MTHPGPERPVHEHYALLPGEGSPTVFCPVCSVEVFEIFICELADLFLIFPCEHWVDPDEVDFGDPVAGSGSGAAQT